MWLGDRLSAKAGGLRFTRWRMISVTMTWLSMRFFLGRLRRPIRVVLGTACVRVATKGEAMALLARKTGKKQCPESRTGLKPFARMGEPGAKPRCAMQPVSACNQGSSDGSV